mmetsp:Transcript_26738/g.83761  ORF Transcript_26738/g.83761 Transcript_26738/m.83761 type:complete len:413 (+) Transcript_26738:281-1519(+)
MMVILFLSRRGVAPWQRGALQIAPIFLLREGRVAGLGALGLAGGLERVAQHGLGAAHDGGVEVFHVLLDEGVLGALGQRREGVVHVAVVRLVGEHVLEAGGPGGVVLEGPVGLGDLRRRQVRPRRVQVRALHLAVLHDVGVGVHRRLLEVAHEAVHRRRRHGVRGHEQRRHAHLRRDDERARADAGVEHLQAHEQVHALVLRLLEEGVDGAVVALERAQRVEVPEARREEPRHAGEALEDDEPPLDGLRRRVLVRVARDGVERPVKALHDAAREVVAEGHRLVLLVLRGHAVRDLLLGPDVVLLPPAVVRDLLLGHGLRRRGPRRRPLGKCARRLGRRRPQGSPLRLAGAGRPRREHRAAPQHHVRACMCVSCVCGGGLAGPGLGFGLGFGARPWGPGVRPPLPTFSANESP